MKQLEHIRRVTTPYSAVEQLSLKHLTGITADHEASIKTAAQMALSTVVGYSAVVEHLGQMAAQISTVQTAAQEIARRYEDVHQTWKESILGGIELASQRVAMQVQMVLSSAIHEATISQSAFAAIDFSPVLSTVRMQYEAYQTISATAASILNSYNKLSESISTPIALAVLPNFVFPGATRELFIGSIVTRITTSERNADFSKEESEVLSGYYEDLSEIESLLVHFDKDLLIPYRGAKEALSSTSTDKGRHVLSSSRDLLIHVIHKLAPDDAVLQWIPEGMAEFVDRGKPTRRARVEFICRGIGHGPLTSFVNVDSKSTAQLIEFLNRVHELNNSLSEKQLKAVVLRIDALLLYLLQISRMAN